MNHKLKIRKEYFLDVLSGAKTFEVRKNDRRFQLKDELTLEEYDGTQGYTGRYIRASISYILDDPEYCKAGYVILGIRVEEASI